MYSNRPERKILKKLCPYCGKTRTYTYREGYTEVDYSSARDQYIPSRTDDQGCDCILGKMEHSVEKFKIKKQCENCAYNKLGRCTNEKERNDVSELFGITGDLVIKDKSRRCKHYQLSKEIFNDFVEFLN